ncbi:MAG TPA: type II toxin-antitoxin system Phd/YefM family antitoxin [Solirubrobacteraceae bacterium]
MTEVGVHEAKTRLSELLREVADGEEIVVTKSGRPVARIVPAGAPRGDVARFGVLADEIKDPGDWDEDESDALGDLFGLPRA